MIPSLTKATHLLLVLCLFFRDAKSFQGSNGSRGYGIIDEKKANEEANHGTLHHNSKLLRHRATTTWTSSSEKDIKGSRRVQMNENGNGYGYGNRNSTNPGNGAKHGNGTNGSHHGWNEEMSGNGYGKNNSESNDGDSALLQEWSENEEDGASEDSERQFRNHSGCEEDSADSIDGTDNDSADSIDGTDNDAASVDDEDDTRTRHLKHGRGLDCGDYLSPITSITEEDAVVKAQYARSSSQMTSLLFPTFVASLAAMQLL